MKRLTVAVLLLLSCVGCSSTCKDGTGSFLVWDRGNYKSCGMECCPKDQETEAKECRCSANCPCWKRHK